MVSGGGFALLSKQDMVMHFGFHTPCTQNSGVVSPKHTNSFKVSQSARLKKKKKQVQRQPNRISIRLCQYTAEDLSNFIFFQSY